MAKRTSFTTPQERLERRIKNTEDEIVALRGMVDPERGIVSAQAIIVGDDPAASQVIKVSESGDLDLGSGTLPKVLKSNVAATHTGDTSETTVKTLTIAGGDMGINGSILISSIWTSVAAGPGTAAFFVYFGQTIAANRIGHYIDVPGVLIDSRPLRVWNKGATNAQSAVGEAATMPFHVGGGVSIIDLTEDATGDVDIFFRVQSTRAAASATLESAMIEIFRAD